MKDETGKAAVKRRVRPVVAAAVPFRSYNPHVMDHEAIRQALRGQGQSLVGAAVVQLLEGELGRAVTLMADRVDGAAETYKMLREFYEGLTELLDGEKVDEK